MAGIIPDGAGEIIIQKQYLKGKRMVILLPMNTVKTFDKISLLRLAFNGLDEVELEEMAALTELRTYPAGYILCREGADEDIFYILVEGSAVISKSLGAPGSERILRTAGAGDLIGEMALIQNAPRAATVRTTTECTVLEMEKSDFETMLQRSPHMAIDIIRITLDRLRENDQRMIAELQKANKVLRQLDRNKTEFIDVAAHELRTPITILKGYADLLNSSPDVQHHPNLALAAEGVISGADRIHAIVNTMLDVARIDGEPQTLRLVPVLLKQTIFEVMNGLRKAASERKIELSHIHETDTPLIHGDPGLIHKALYHLVINAIKYTPDGGKVTVSTKRARGENEAEGALIEVRDTGIGLDAEHHQLVFDKFYQAGDAIIHSSGTTSFKGGGPGLGLAIVHGVAKSHGGRCWVESAGHDEVNFPGSSFYLFLPLGKGGRV
jgi:signal transduction histidine kinase